MLLVSYMQRLIYNSTIDCVVVSWSTSGYVHVVPLIHQASPHEQKSVEKPASHTALHGPGGTVSPMRLPDPPNRLLTFEFAFT